LNIRKRLSCTALLLAGVAFTTPALAQQAAKELSSDSVIETIKKRGAIKILQTIWV